MSAAGMKAYEINDYEWIAVPETWTRDQMEVWYLKETGVDKEEGFDGEPREVPATAIIMTPDEEEAQTTVEAAINEYVARNGVEPFLLACTEY